MSEMDYSRLLSSLAAVTPLPLVKPPEGFRYQTDSDPQFVPPPLEQVRGLVPGHTAVVLIEAAAAMGKSALAKDVAVRRKAPYWDLAPTPVSGGAFVGGLSWSYGHPGTPGSQIATVMEGLKNGSFVVIVDGLDEAVVASKTVPFEAFLSEIADLLHIAPTSPTVIMLGRKESIDLASLYLEANDVSYAHLRIGYFTKEGARNFISAQLDDLYRKKGEQPQHKNERFHEALTGFFELIYGLILEKVGPEQDAWHNLTVRSILGYAPVLQAVSQYFFDERPNWYRVEQDLRKVRVQRGWAGVWQLFTTILDRILVREQDEKTKPLLKIRLGSLAKSEGWEKWDSLYTPGEQRQRILACDPLNILHQELPARPKLPDSMRAEYERAILRDRIPDHPFRRDNARLDNFVNVVFRDDTYAWLLASNDVTAEQKKGLRDRLRGPWYLQSPVLYSSLYARLSTGSEEPTIDEEDVGIIYDSVQSQAGSHAHESTDAKEVELAVSEDSQGELRVTFSYGNGGQTLGGFRVRNTGEGLIFTKRLSNARIITPSKTVALGVEGAEFVLGPGVRLDCQELRILAEEVHFDTGKPQKGGPKGADEHVLVELIAEQCDPGTARLVIADHAKRHLKIDWGTTRPLSRWAEFASTLKVSRTIEAKGLSPELLRALEVIARRRYSFLDLTKGSGLLKDFSPSVLETLWQSGILKRREKSIRGDAADKPELDVSVVTALAANADDVARGRLPIWVYERVKHSSE